MIGRRSTPLRERAIWTSCSCSWLGAPASTASTWCGTNTPVPVAGVGRLTLSRRVCGPGSRGDRDDAPFPQDGLTPLHFAAEKGRVDVVRQLLKSGAAIDASSNRFSGTPLHVAGAAGRKKVVRLLLDAGASPAASNTVRFRPSRIPPPPIRRPVKDSLGPLLRFI